MNGLDQGIDWRKPMAVLAVVILLSWAGVTLLGGQVSGILSTVGASVGPGGGVACCDAEPGEPDPGSAAGEPDGQPGDDGATGGSAVASLVDGARPDLLIIKTGSILVQAADVDAALAESTRLMVQLGGYASASERSGDGDDAQASTTYRIPADRWEAALLAAREVGEKVLDERSATEDVTGQVVDLEARIRNLETTERALQSIMDRASGIKDVLSVQQELTTVRGEIEQLASRSADLRERATLSTLTITISKKPQPVVAQQEARFDAGTEAEAATARLVSILQDLATAGIWFAIVWLPILIALGIVSGIGFLAVRRLRRAFDAGAPIATPSGEGA